MYVPLSVINILVWLQKEPVQAPALLLIVVVVINREVKVLPVLTDLPEQALTGQPAEEYYS